MPARALWGLPKVQCVRSAVGGAFTPRAEHEVRTSRRTEALTALITEQGWRATVDARDDDANLATASSQRVSEGVAGVGRLRDESRGG